MVGTHFCIERLTSLNFAPVFFEVVVSDNSISLITRLKFNIQFYIYRSPLIDQ